MELKANGYMARENLVTWCSWCSLLVAILESAGSGYGVSCALCAIGSSSVVVVVGSSSKLPFRLVRPDQTRSLQNKKGG